MIEELSFQTLDGLTLRADAWGNPSDPAAIFLHGGGQTRHAWSGTAERLAEQKWYAISLDLRGHGDSDWSPIGDYGHQAFCADITAVASSLKKTPVLIGASLGGISSLSALGEASRLDQPPLASGLILVDIATRMEIRGAERVLAFMRDNSKGFSTLEEAADAIATYNPHRPRPKDLAGLKKNLRLQPNGRYLWHWDPAFLEGRLTPSSMGDLGSLEVAARGLSIPTLLVRGRMSDLLSEEGAREFLEQVPHAHFVDVSGAGHMVAGDRNDLFTEAVLSFLEKEISLGPSRSLS